VGICAGISVAGDVSVTVGAIIDPPVGVGISAGPGVDVGSVGLERGVTTSPPQPASSISVDSSSSTAFISSPPQEPPPIIPVRGMARSDVRRAQKQALTVVGQHDYFIGGFSLFVALHWANKCKPKGEKPRNKARDLLYQFLYQRGEKW
jgi:hypothetical protein